MGAQFAGVQGNLIPQGELKVFTRKFIQDGLVKVQGNLIPQGELKVSKPRLDVLIPPCPRKSNSPRGIERRFD